VCEDLQWLGGGHAEAVRASKSAISQARTRLGSQEMRQWAERVLRPLAPLGVPGAWYRGLRVMAPDGACLDVADGAANAEFFGYPGTSRGQSAFPQARLLSLVACSTRVVTAAVVAPCGRSEQAMAAQWLSAELKPAMLVLGRTTASSASSSGRCFMLWQMACAIGASLVWRVKADCKLPVEQVLGDGSSLSLVSHSKDRRPVNGHAVRVIDHGLRDSAAPAEDRYRLVMNILDPVQAPDLELAALYRERWEIDGVCDAFKSHLRANSTVLRSRTPDLVLQELWGLLLAHFAIRRLMAQVAWPRGLDPERLSVRHGGAGLNQQHQPHSAFSI
jgi:hypothetical protein